MFHVPWPFNEIPSITMQQKYTPEIFAKYIRWLSYKTFDIIVTANNIQTANLSYSQDGEFLFDNWIF